MARLNELIDNDSSEDELPELAQLLRSTSRKPSIKKSQEGDTEGYCLQGDLLNGNTIVARSTGIKKAIVYTSSEGRTEKPQAQGALKLASVNPLLLPTFEDKSYSIGKCHQCKDSTGPTQRLRQSPQRAARKVVDYSAFATRQTDELTSESTDDESFTDLSGFIVPDSANEAEERSWKPRRVKEHEPSRKARRPEQTLQQAPTKKSLTKDVCSQPSKVTASPVRKETPLDTEPSQYPSEVVPVAKPCDALSQTFELNDPLSQLKFSPPRSRKPSRIKGSERPLATPPANPSKFEVESSPAKCRIPPSPHRPSIDAFWSQDVINEWNDQYSPKKPPRTPIHTRLSVNDESDEDYAKESASPRKSHVRSPSKKDRLAIKIFSAERSSLATTFLAELDERITQSQISNLAASTGGTKIVWSKKLSSTAGRAHWRREAIRHKAADGTYSEPTTYRHHASIELAEKVIDNEERLINVLAHEFCHLANFMISGVKDRPHGKEFKTWAAKVTAAFRHRGVEVTTKHGYDITYKYIWSCSECGLEYKRHSKSIDPSKHGCGACKGRLLQILPAPRKENEYQKFVKANWETFKQRAGDKAGMGEINGLLAKEWEVRKGGGKQVGEARDETTTGVADDVCAESIQGSSELDNVARKLDFLNLAK